MKRSILFGALVALHTTIWGCAASQPPPAPVPSPPKVERSGDQPQRYTVVFELHSEDDFSTYVMAVRPLRMPEPLFEGKSRCKEQVCVTRAMAGGHKFTFNLIRWGESAAVVIAEDQYVVKLEKCEQGFYGSWSSLSCMFSF